MLDRASIAHPSVPPRSYQFRVDAKVLDLEPIPRSAMSANVPDLARLVPSDLPSILPSTLVECHQV